MTFAEFHDDVQEVHAVEFHLFAECNAVVQVRQIFVGSNVGQDIEEFPLLMSAAVMPADLLRIT